MGDMADYYINNMLDRELEFSDFKWYGNANNIKSDEWETKDGKIYKIKDMTESHIINTYNYLRRKNRKIPKMIAERFAEIEFRKKKASLIRDKHNLTEEISDSEIIKAYEGSLLEARIDLQLSIEKLQNEIMNAFNISKFLKA